MARRSAANVRAHFSRGCGWLSELRAGRPCRLRYLRPRRGLARSTTRANSGLLRAISICPKSRGVPLANSYMALHDTHGAGSCGTSTGHRYVLGLQRALLAGRPETPYPESAACDLPQIWQHATYASCGRLSDPTNRPRTPAACYAQFSESSRFRCARAQHANDCSPAADPALSAGHEYASRLATRAPSRSASGVDRGPWPTRHAAGRIYAVHA